MLCTLLHTALQLLIHRLGKKKKQYVVLLMAHTKILNKIVRIAYSNILC